MKKTIVALAVLASLLSGCVVYDERPRGGPGNGFCPPGQAKKGNC